MNEKQTPGSKQDEALPVKTISTVLGCSHQPPCPGTEAAAIEAAPCRAFVVVETDKGHEVWPDPDGPITAVFTERSDADLFVFAASVLPVANINDLRSKVREYWKTKQRESRTRRTKKALPEKTT